MMKKAALGIIVLLLLGAAVSFLQHPRASELTLRHLASGDVMGYEAESGCLAWLGIPCADLHLNQMDICG